MNFIQKMKRLSVCGKDGWYHQGAITIIRDKFREFVLQKIEEFISKPRFCNSTELSADVSEKRSGESSGGNMMDEVENKNKSNGNGTKIDHENGNVDTTKNNSNNNTNSNNNNSSSSSSSSSASTNRRAAKDESSGTEASNNMILCERLLYWQRRYLSLPDSGIATDADILAYQNYFELHRKRSVIKSHRLQRIFRMVGRSLTDPKQGRSRDRSRKSIQGGDKEISREHTMGKRKRKKKEKFLDIDSDSEENEGEDGENPRHCYHHHHY